MRRAAIIFGAVLCAVAPGAAPAHAQENPDAELSVAEGQPGRELLSGRWYFRRDDFNVGIDNRFQSQRSLAGWGRVSVPVDFNATEIVTNRSSVGWFRRDISVKKPVPGEHRILRFEGAGHFSTVYLNGKRITQHAGSYLPFEADLGELKKGKNRLVVRVSSMRAKTDLSHWRAARFNGFGNGGWWNFGGIHREIAARRARGIDIERVQAVPRMRCATCAARVQVHIVARNLTPVKVRVPISLRAGKRLVRVTPRYFNAGQRREIVTSFTIAKPKLWDIGKGNLYTLKAEARIARTRLAETEEQRAKRERARPPRPAPMLAPQKARYETTFGVRDLRKTADGVVLLNGRPIRALGASYHEDDLAVGSAWRAPQRAQILQRLQELGATIVRAHYPLHPAVIEELDRRGVLVYDEAPVYQVQNDRWDLPQVRRNAVNLNEEVVRRDRGRPSVIVYSMANELPDTVTPGQAAFVRSAAARIRKLDPTRLVAIDRSSRIAQEGDAHPIWKSVDVIGVNEYFGWYRGAFPPLPEATSEDLGPYLDTLHGQQPHAALFVTEFGAEANRDGPETEKGTYAFQTRFLRKHLEIDRSRPFLNGAMIWALKDFRVIPNWAGGNPKPNPPFNHKGLLDLYGNPKPAWEAIKRIFAERRGRL